MDDAQEGQVSGMQQDVAFSPTGVCVWGLIRSAGFLALIGYTHLPLAMLSGYALAILASCDIFTSRTLAPGGRLLYILGISGCLMAPYALPAMAGLKDLNFRFLDSVVPWVRRDFLDDPLVFGGQEEVFNLIRGAFRLATVPLLLSSAAAFLILWNRGNSCARLRQLSIAGFFFLFMNLRASLPLWELLPGVAILQYPFRWLWPGFLLLAPGLCMLIESNPRGLFERLARGAGTVSIICMIFLGVQAQIQAKPFSELREALDIAFYYPPEYLPVTLPEANPPRHKAGTFRTIRTLQGTASIRREVHQFARSEWDCTIGSGSAFLQITTHFDPSWRLLADGRSIGIEPSLKGGLISFSLPSGEYHLVLYREPPFFRSVGWFLCFLGILSFAFLPRPFFGRFPGQEPDSSKTEAR